MPSLKIMKGKKIFRIYLGVIISFLIVNFAYGEEADHLNKEKALAFKIGWLSHESSNFTDFWLIDEDDLDTSFFEIGYETYFKNSLSIEYVFGFSSPSVNYKNVLFLNDSSHLDYVNLYFSPSLKIRSRLNDTFRLYGGIGPDFYYTRANYEYQFGTFEFNISESFLTLGFHGLIGIEIFLIKKPDPNQFDWPLSLNIEYKYARIEINDADKDVIDTINAFFGSNLNPNDAKVGGDMISLLLKWHF